MKSFGYRSDRLRFEWGGGAVRTALASLQRMDWSGVRKSECSETR